MFTFEITLIFWLCLSAIPLFVSFAYFRTSPSDISIIHRIATSLHGVVVSIVCFCAVLIGMLGAPSPALGKLFGSAFFVPIAFIIYSFYSFKGKRSVHFLQSINIIWLAFAFIFGSMAVTGTWV